MRDFDALEKFNICEKPAKIQRFGEMFQGAHLLRGLFYREKISPIFCLIGGAAK